MSLLVDNEFDVVEMNEGKDVLQIRENDNGEITSKANADRETELGFPVAYRSYRYHFTFKKKCRIYKHKK